MTDPLDLLRLEGDARWVTDERGRVVRTRTPELRPHPLVAIAVPVDGPGRVWVIAAEVPDDVATGIDAALDAGGGEADVVDRLRRAGLAPGPEERGPSYVADPTQHPFRVRIDATQVGTRTRNGLDVRVDTDPDAEDARRRVPAADRALVPPWAIALVDGEVAAVCETARDAPSAVEAGVWTYEPHRRKGLATAVVAAWIGRTAGRTAFYSTTDDNHASQAVARRLGLTPLGQWWWVSAP